MFLFNVNCKDAQIPLNQNKAVYLRQTSDSILDYNEVKSEHTDKIVLFLYSHGFKLSDNEVKSGEHREKATTNPLRRHRKLALLIPAELAWKSSQFYVFFSVKIMQR